MEERSPKLSVKVRNLYNGEHGKLRAVLSVTIGVYLHPGRTMEIFPIWGIEERAAGCSRGFKEGVGGRNYVDRGTAPFVKDRSS